MLKILFFFTYKASCVRTIECFIKLSFYVRSNDSNVIFKVRHLQYGCLLNMIKIRRKYIKNRKWPIEINLEIKLCKLGKLNILG